VLLRLTRSSAPQRFHSAFKRSRQGMPSGMLRNRVIGFGVRELVTKTN
jgi:hypothetical protein